MITKKERWTLGLLLVVTLVGAMFVPVVSAVAPQKLIVENQIDLETAYDSAVAAFKLHINSIESTDTKIWKKANIQKENVLKVYDISKNLQYYEFDIVDNGIVVGEIRASANKLLGTPVLSIECQPNNLKKKLSETKNYYDKKGIDSTIVSYSTYQGLLIESAPGIKSNNYVYDLYWNSKVLASDLKSCYEMEDITAYNMIKNWNHLYKFEQDASVNLTKSKTLQNYYELSGVPFQHWDHDKWCGVASAQMVAGFNGDYESQSEIADYMGINTTQGCTFNDQYRYFYFHLNYNHFSDDDDIPFDDYIDAIGTDSNPGYPVIDEILTSLGYHDRVAVGWQEYTGGSKILKVHDPAKSSSSYEYFVSNHPFAAFTYP
ncbi:hypothetical protein [Methanoplanus limicola]|uniref:Peptidase C39-like domain-containing protein n=1 Tax=Methanoplanus limicola DSM 2279 TaxID=937775 RepID=H1Z018_9EURY|nr:hypothetical protein [Methanoplanus limicola]EHQ35225.1 hypothetical protein Metlim_1114 [Methanoplanus limicola DSM 2279]